MLNLRGDKKGSHVGLIISFMIFVTFMFFVMVIIQPSFNTNKDKKALGLGIEEKIIEKCSLELSSATIVLKSSVSANCISFVSIISDLNLSSGIIVKNVAGSVVPSSVSLSNQNTLQLNRASITEEFFKIYSGTGFDSLSAESLSCQIVAESSGYEIGIVKKEKFLFESQIESKIELYSNYALLRGDFSLPKSTDAQIDFEYNNGTRISTGVDTPTTNVFVSEKTIEYISRQGDILPGKIIVKIW